MAKRKVFLSYSRENTARVQSLYERLSGAGFKPWMDLKDLLPGVPFEVVTQQAIQTSDFFLACLTKSSVDSEGYFKKEREWALNHLEKKRKRGIYLIPVKLEPCDAPADLKSYNWVELYKPDGWDRLWRALYSREVSPRRGIVAGFVAGLLGSLLSDLIRQGGVGSPFTLPQVVVILLMTLAGFCAGLWASRRPFSLPRFLQFRPGRSLFMNGLVFVLLAALAATPLTLGLRLLMRNHDCVDVDVAALELELSAGRKKFSEREITLQSLDLYNRQNLAGRALLTDLADGEECVCEWWVKTNSLPRQLLPPRSEAKDCIFSIPLHNDVTEINLTLNVGRRTGASGFEKVKYFRFKINVQQ